MVVTITVEKNQVSWIGFVYENHGNNTYYRCNNVDYQSYLTQPSCFSAIYNKQIWTIGCTVNTYVYTIVNHGIS